MDLTNPKIQKIDFNESFQGGPVLGEYFSQFGGMSGGTLQSQVKFSAKSCPKPVQLERRVLWRGMFVISCVSFCTGISYPHRRSQRYAAKKARSAAKTRSA